MTTGKILFYIAVFVFKIKKIQYLPTGGCTVLKTTVGKALLIISLKN